MTKPPPLPPIPDADWPEEIADLRDGFAGRLNVYRVMAHHPALLRAWAPLRQHIVADSALGPDLSEVVILRAGYRLGSAYEWGHHVVRARKLGFDDARISALRGQPDGLDGRIVRAVDALIDTHRLPADLDADLAGELGRLAVMDLIATVGFYGVLGAILLSYDTPLDDDIAAALAAAPVPLDR